MRPHDVLKTASNVLFILLINIHINIAECNESEFPEGFLLGVASSAYQIEGGHNAEGKGPNIFDYFTRLRPDLFNNKSNGDVAADSYNKWQEDIKLLKQLGVDHYRFSISWSRILPEGYTGNLNKAGIEFYNRFIDALVENGIEPMVTMYHWDLPLNLVNLGSWTNPYLANYFEDYASILFTKFGDRVKYWITMNSGCLGYADDFFPPYYNKSGIANYLCNHVMLLAHAKAYRLYDKQFRPTQHGKVGLTIDGKWFEPGSTSQQDIYATERARQFVIGLIANPVFHSAGDYPQIVKDRIAEQSKKEGFLRSRLPEFSKEEVELIRGSFDFIGLNIYTTYLVRHVPEEKFSGVSLDRDGQLKLFQDNSWPKSRSGWLRVVPSTMRNVLKWFKETYNDPEIIITENGYSDEGQLEDTDRINYYQGYLKSLLEAIHLDGVKVKGYTAWSLLDNFEWVAGYSERFGLVHVDFDDPDRIRTPKLSAKWFAKVLEKRKLVTLDEVEKIEKKSSIKGEL